MINPDTLIIAQKMTPECWEMNTFIILDFNIYTRYVMKIRLITPNDMVLFKLLSPNTAHTRITVWKMKYEFLKTLFFIQNYYTKFQLPHDRD
jgi:hypothetical protein